VTDKFKFFLALSHFKQEKTNKREIPAMWLNLIIILRLPAYHKRTTLLSESPYKGTVEDIFAYVCRHLVPKREGYAGIRG